MVLGEASGPQRRPPLQPVRSCDGPAMNSPWDTGRGASLFQAPLFLTKARLRQMVIEVSLSLARKDGDSSPPPDI